MRCAHYVAYEPAWSTCASALASANPLRGTSGTLAYYGPAWSDATLVPYYTSNAALRYQVAYQQRCPTSGGALGAPSQHPRPSWLRGTLVR